MSWADAARATIRKVHDGLPATTTLADRVKAVDAASPFGSRECWPYKVWLKERRYYLARFGYRRNVNEPQGTLL